jgi:Tol biopolymer transport system component
VTSRVERHPWPAAPIRLVTALLVVGVVSAACGSSTPERIDDDAVYFNCLEQFVERIRQATCRVDVDSGDIEEVFAESITTWGPSISPDRRHILLTADPDPGSFDVPSEFVVLDAQHVVTRSFATNGSIDRSWSPTSDSFLTATDTGVAIIPLDGSAPERIDVSPSARMYVQAMSPDGSLIAAAIGGLEEPTFLVVYDAMSGVEESRTETGPISSLAWSSDGRLAIGSSSGLLLLDPETDDFSVVDSSQVDRYFGVSWSPDDTTIAAVRGGQLVLHDVERETQQPLTPDDVSVTSGPPAWSPNGERIVVALTNGSDLFPHLVMIDVELGTLTDLTPAAEQPGDAGAAYPVWR